MEEAPTRTARVWKRILAFLLDLYLGTTVTWSFMVLLQAELPTSFSTLASASFILSPLAAMLIIYISLFMLLYHVFCEYIVGQTPGMMLFGVKVVRVQNTSSSSKKNTNKYSTNKSNSISVFRTGKSGESKKQINEKEGIAFWQALIRNIFIIPVMPFTLLWLIEPIYYMFQGERLVDHLTKTETVE